MANPLNTEEFKKIESDRKAKEQMLKVEQDAAKSKLAKKLEVRRALEAIMEETEQKQ